MLQIDNTIVSFEVLNNNFVCDLTKCKGACCVEGDSGAPLTNNEVEILDTLYSKIKPFMRDECIKEVEIQGTWVIDSDGDKVTPLRNGKECVYVYFNNKIAYCAIEKAFNEKKINWQKPISCHLYPIRISKFEKLEAVNYHKWPICSNAIVKGNKKNIKLFEFLKPPLIQNYGINWYNELKLAAELLHSNNLKS